MSINIIPGYDFTFNEIVTSEKLRKWIEGASNSDELTIGDVGLTGEDTGIGLKTTSTWATGVSQGTVAFNTTTGWATVSTKWGYVPLFGTQGGMFSMRIPEGDSTEDSFDRFYEGDTPNMIGPNAAHTPTLPAASYSLGEGYDLFGMNSVNVSSKFVASADVSEHRAGKTFARYPSEKSFNASDAWTASTYVTGASFVHSLYKLGGIQTIRYSFFQNFAGATNISYMGTLADDGERKDGKSLDVDEGNNLVFVPKRGGGIVSYYISTTMSSASEVDMHDEGNRSNGAEFLKYIEDKNLLLTHSISYFSIFGVDNLGYFTFLKNFYKPSTSRDMVYDPTSDFMAGAWHGDGVCIIKVNSGTDATLTDIVDTDNFRSDCCALLHDGTILTTGSYDTGAQDVFSVSPEGNLTFIGQETPQPSSLNRKFYTDPDNTAIYGSVTNMGFRLFEMSSTGSIRELDNATRGNDTFKGVKIRDDIAIIGGALNGAILYDISVATNITQLYYWNASGENRNGVQFNRHYIFANADDRTLDTFRYDPLTSGNTALSCINGEAIEGKWKLNSTATSPIRVYPLSQCMNYDGKNQISGGFIPPSLSKDNFSTGGYEH